MKKLRSPLIWFYMLCKRLIKKASFVAVLCIIPVLVIVMSMASQDSKGVLTIALCSQDKNDSVSTSMINRLVSEESIVNFKVFESPSEARNQVINGKADAAWIFNGKTQENIDYYAANELWKSPLVTVLQREDNITLQMSLMKLYNVVYPHISYSIYKNFTYNEITSSNMVSEEDLQNAYDEIQLNGSLIEMHNIDSGTYKNSKDNYLITPLRGMLVIAVLLCGLAAAMYFLRDLEAGVYSRTPASKRIYPFAGNCLAAVLCSSIVVLVTLGISGLLVNFGLELTAMSLYVLSSAAFCVLIGLLCRSVKILGALTPFILIITLIICPIFMKLPQLKALQALFPPYYYLCSIFDYTYLINMAIYTLILFILVLLLNRILNRR